MRLLVRWKVKKNINLSVFGGKQPFPMHSWQLCFSMCIGFQLCLVASDSTFFFLTEENFMKGGLVYTRNDKISLNSPSQEMTCFFFFDNLHRWKLSRLCSSKEYEIDFPQLNYSLFLHNYFLSSCMTGEASVTPAVLPMSVRKQSRNPPI